VQFFRASFLVATALLTVGCSAQNADQSGLSAADKHRIEVNLRKKYSSIPLEVQFEFGQRKPSEFSGYDTLPVTLTNGERRSTLEFLISADNKTVARLEKLDVATTPNEVIDLQGRPVRGNPDAKVTIINFDDFQCPFCEQMHHSIVKELLPKYGDRVRIIYKDYPLGNHPWAVHAAVNANCVADQNHKAYWEYADWMHENRETITQNEKGAKRPLIEQTSRLDEGARSVARKNGLDTEKLNACIKKQDDSQVKASVAEGDKLGIDSTPTVFVDGEKVNGAYPFEQYRMAIDRALRAKGQPVPEPDKAETPAPSASPGKK